MQLDTTYRDAIQDTADLETFAAALEASGLPFTWSGLCLWIDATPADMTGKQINTLHLIGARYSGKRDRYYLRSNGTPKLAVARTAARRRNSSAEFRAWFKNKKQFAVGRWEK